MPLKRYSQNLGIVARINQTLAEIDCKFLGSAPNKRSHVVDDKDFHGCCLANQ
jgi:hypothetical protein